jgi:hypothetical protein
MKVRNHPLMSNAKGRIWPPIWKEKYGETTLTGEIGVLTHVGSNPAWSHKFHVHITHEDLPFIGTLIFDNSRFCHRVSIFLKKHIGQAIKEIGDLEL